MIVIELTYNKDRLEIVVRDTGIGIPRESQKKIFEVFSQVESDSRRAYEGTGLGLSDGAAAHHLNGRSCRGRI